MGKSPCHWCPPSLYYYPRGFTSVLQYLHVCVILTNDMALQSASFEYVASVLGAITNFNNCILFWISTLLPTVFMGSVHNLNPDFIVLLPSPPKAEFGNSTVPVYSFFGQCINTTCNFPPASHLTDAFTMFYRFIPPSALYIPLCPYVNFIFNTIEISACI